MTRREKRERIEEIHMAGEVKKAIGHYFPDFIKSLGRVKDPRNPSYITYPSTMLLLMRIIGAISSIGSMRSLTNETNCTICIENIGEILGIKNLEELPHWSTINNFLEKVSPQDIEMLNQALVTRLIRMRSFEDYRYRKFWQILVDGTGLYCFHTRHCEHCLSRVFNKNTPEEYTLYYHYVLEAKILLAPNLVVNIATEFIENTPNVSMDSQDGKQDCELKAFYRLTQKLKSSFKRLPICLTLDSLYACKPVFDICLKNKWHFIIRFKSGSLPSVAQEVSSLKELSPNNSCNYITDTGTEHYSFVCDILYESVRINYADLLISSHNIPDSYFAFITDFSLNVYNVKSFIQTGRLRWKIENEGFNFQKNNGLFLSHLFSLHPTAMKNHYLLIQLAHTLLQLSLIRLLIVHVLCGSIEQFRKIFLRSLCSIPLSSFHSSGSG